MAEDWLDDLLDAVVSEHQRLRAFDKVNTAEPTRKPGRGLTAAIWPQRIVPVEEDSGMASTSALVIFMSRLYKNIDTRSTEPQDQINIYMLRATSALMRLFNADFTLSGLIKCVDVLGMHGTKLEAGAGYLDQDNAKFRIMDITIPCVVSDVWPQATGA